MKKVSYFILLIAMLFVGNLYVSAATTQCTYKLWEKGDESSAIYKAFAATGMLAKDRRNNPVVAELIFTFDLDKKSISNIGLSHAFINTTKSKFRKAGQVAYFEAISSSNSDNIIQFSSGDSLGGVSNIGQCPTLYYADFSIDDVYSFSISAFYEGMASDGYILSTNQSEQQYKDVKYNSTIYRYHYYNNNIDQTIDVPICLMATMESSATDYKYWYIANPNEADCTTFDKSAYFPIGQKSGFNSDQMPKPLSPYIEVDISHRQEDIYVAEGYLNCPSVITYVKNLTGQNHGVPGFDEQGFLDVIEVLQPYLIRYAQVKGFSVDRYGSLTINGQEKKFPWISNKDYGIRESDDEIEYAVGDKIKKVVQYCNSFYDNYNKLKKDDPDNAEKRKEECSSFNDFYVKGVNDNLFNNFSSGCSMISKDASDIVNWVLNIIRIAGPLIAIGFGMVDFAKTVVSGDADKELKSAGQRFLKRIIAAVVLILVPTILSLLMNIFLANQSGYDADNPFCIMVNWEK